MELYADIIIDISHADLDKTFQYIVPEEFINDINIGSRVKVPFGSLKNGRFGYVVGLSHKPKIEPERIKKIIDCPAKQLPVESRLIKLAGWMKDYYGGTMIAALNTVTPVKEKVRKTAVRKDTREYIADMVPVEALNEEQQKASENGNKVKEQQKDKEQQQRQPWQYSAKKFHRQIVESQLHKRALKKKAAAKYGLFDLSFYNTAQLRKSAEALL